MNAYNKCRELEDESMAMTLAYLKFLDDESKIFMTQDHEFLQAIYGDIIAKFSSGSISTIELKAESSNDYGNLFLESWSNRAKTNPGWMLKCKARHLWYYFLEQDELYTMQFHELREWAFVQHGITDFPEKPQKRHEQLNDTWRDGVFQLFICNRV